MGNGKDVVKLRLVMKCCDDKEVRTKKGDGPVYIPEKGGRTGEIVAPSLPIDASFCCGCLMV